MTHIDFFVNSVQDGPTIDTVNGKVSPGVRIKYPTEVSGEWTHLLFDLGGANESFKKYNNMRTVRSVRCDFVNVTDGTLITDEYAKIRYVGFFRTREQAQEYHEKIMKKRG